jgi:hypothetical protein
VPRAQKHAEELAVLESLDNGKPFHIARSVDVPLVRSLESSTPGPHAVALQCAHNCRS